MTRFLFALAFASVLTGAPANSITVDSLGGTQINRPVTIGRVFRQGEFTAGHCVQGIASGGEYDRPTALVTQTDIKNRYRDGTKMVTITAVTATYPVTATAANHGFLDGEKITVAGVGVVANGDYRIHYVRKNSFVLVNAKVLGAFTAGGTAVGPDYGSLRFAVVSFRANLPASGALTVTFVPGACDNTGYLTPAQMLQVGKYNFGARLEVTPQGQSTISQDARQMLGAPHNHYTYWLQGPVVTQVILRDNTPALGHDMAGLHPIFIATFYPGLTSVRVDTILDNDSTTDAQDRSYSFALKLQQPLDKTPVYCGPGCGTAFRHNAYTRWHHIDWSGPEPAKINVNQNFAYLISTKMLPYYDLTKTADAQTELDWFNSLDKGEIGGGGQIHGISTYKPAMADSGGAAERALIARWFLTYLYTFDSRLEPVMRGDAEFSGHIPLNMRETITGRFYDEDHLVDAFGRITSLYARPTFRSDWRGYYSSASSAMDDADRIVETGPIGPAENHDMGHLPDPNWVPYLLTGDWYYLDEMMMWGAYATNSGDPGTCGYCRHGLWGFQNDRLMVRSSAWAARATAHAAIMALDNSPEKLYFNRFAINNIAIREGTLNITRGYFYDANPASMWYWGRWGAFFSDIPGVNAALLKGNPLHSFGNSEEMEQLNASVTDAGSAPWWFNYFHQVIGHMDELGFPIRPVQDTALKHLLGQLQSPDYNPWLVGHYRIPVRDKTTQDFISSWARLRSGYEQPNITGWPPDTYPEDGTGSYPAIARAAATFMVAHNVTENGWSAQAGYDWLEAHMNLSILNGEGLIWALAPRPGDPVLPPGSHLHFRGLLP